MKNLNFSQRLVVTFLFITLSGLVLCGVLSYKQSSKIVLQLVLHELTTKVNALEHTINISYETNMDHIKRISGKLSKEFTPRLAVTESAQEVRQIENQVTGEVIQAAIPQVLFDGKAIVANEVVDGIGEKEDLVVSILLKVPTGLVRVTTNIKKSNGERAVGTFIPLESPVTKTVFGGKTYYGRANILNSWYLTSYEPFYDKNGQVVGTFFIGVKEKTYDKIIENLKKEKLLETGYYYVLDKKGLMVLHPTLQGKNMLEATDADGKFIFRDIVTKGDGLIKYNWKLPSGSIVEKAAIYKYFPLLDAIIVAGINVDEANAKLSELKGTFLFTTLAVLLFTALIVTLFAKKISKTLVEITSNIGHTAENTMKQSNQVSVLSSKLSESSMQQAAAVHETTSTIDEIKAIVENNLQTIQTTKEISNEVMDQTNNGFKVMKDLDNAVEGIQKKNQDLKEEIIHSYDDIEAIIELVNEIDARTKVINDIVFQTKLLSFNASVEAARVGNAGKGFAVVADEIGKLASMTGRSAVEIQETLEMSKSRVKEIVEASKSKVIDAFVASTNEIETCVQISRDCTNAFEVIRSNVSKSSESMAEVVTASEEQTKAVRNIAEAMVQIDQVTSSITDLSQKGKINSNDLEAEAEQLNKAMVQLKVLVNGEKAA